VKYGIRMLSEWQILRLISVLRLQYLFRQDADRLQMGRNPVY